MKIMYNHIVALAIALIAVAATAAPRVKPGIEVLADNGFEQLQGKRIGLITNPTGVDSHLRATVDIIANAPGVTLAALFAPEHGIRGDVMAGVKVASATDPATGVKVHSLYGSTKKPTAAMLAGLDALVYDIQDNGCRSYTFISTMAGAMEAAAAAGLEFVVLDRPNPLGGNRVEGGGVDDDCRSFVSAIDIPYIYGLTAGELARYILDEGLISARGLKLTVVPMEGWSREMTFSETGLPWVLPSPQIPSPETCLFYPASGIAGELDFFSIGVGYTLPFQTFATPRIDARRLADRLNRQASQGGAVAWRPIHYRPYFGKFKGENVAGVQPYILNPSEVTLTRMQFDVMEAVNALWPEMSPLKATDTNSRNLRMFDQVVGNKRLRQALVAGHYDASLLDTLWGVSPTYLERKSAYHIY